MAAEPSLIVADLLGAIQYLLLRTYRYKSPNAPWYPLIVSPMMYYFSIRWQ